MNAVYEQMIRAEEARKKYPPCGVCGVTAGQPCVYTSAYDGHAKGQIRPRPHFYR